MSMDARLLRCAVLVAAFFSLGAGYRTGNFVVTAPTPQMAEQIGQAAEKYRKDLALDWLGHEMPNWAQPCPITAQVGENLGAGGATSFVFDHNEVFGWRMTIQGSLVRILDSVLPHEVTHTVFATHFRQPLPRWADEGACTTVEHVSEKSKQQNMLIDFLRTGRGIAFSRMFAMKEYPHDVMPLYSQGYSVARYLVAQGGKQKFLEFLADGMRDENWSRAAQGYYGTHDLAALQNDWLSWVRRGSPALDSQKAAGLVAVKNSGSGTTRLQDRGPRPSTATPGPADVADAKPAADGQSIYQLAATSKDAFNSSGVQREQKWRAPRKSAEAADTLAADGDVANAEASPTSGAADKTDLVAVSSASHEVTRPQGVQRAGQVILEWRSPSPDADRQPAAIAGQPRAALN